MSEKKPGTAIELKGITKTFGSVVANDNIDLALQYGEILALLGENGSGKTTLMNMISGIYHPDAGNIFIDGEEAVINSPTDAMDFGIGMIHQHFKLVEVFSAMDNIVLGVKKKKKARELEKEITEIGTKFGLEADPQQKVYNMSVSEKQTVEILKVLYRGAKILILDEPTAVLTPQETEKLFAILRKMKENGAAIIIITHKLNEVLAISDRVTILRKGQSVGTIQTAEADEQKLTELMVGRPVELKIERPDVKEKKEILSVKDLSVRKPDGSMGLKNISFTICSGEILGVAGIAGSGQKELCETIAGLMDPEGGSVKYYGKLEKEDAGKTDSEKADSGKAGEEKRQDRQKEGSAPFGQEAGEKTESGAEIIGMTPRQISALGISMSFVPEDRLGMGLVASMGMVDNMLLKAYDNEKGVFVNRKPAKELAGRLVQQLQIVTPSVHTPVRMMSGGNVQKVLLGREIESNPSVLITAYPVRGLDINSSYLIYDLINQQKKKKVGVMFVGEDLDVLLALCDRVMVLCNGEIVDIVDAKETTKDEIGLMMAGRKLKRREMATPETAEKRPN